MFFFPRTFFGRAIIRVMKSRWEAAKGATKVGADSFLEEDRARVGNCCGWVSGVDIGWCICNLQGMVVPRSLETKLRWPNTSYRSSSCVLYKNVHVAESKAFLGIYTWHLSLSVAQYGCISLLAPAAACVLPSPNVRPWCGGSSPTTSVGTIKTMILWRYSGSDVGTTIS